MITEKVLTMHLVGVTECAALATAPSMGLGDRRESDRLAVEAMRNAFDKIDINGTIVIGEGERDEAPMLFIGEKVGKAGPDSYECDIAVDPLEGTNLVATGAPNAIAVLAVAEKGGLLYAPDVYMEKLIVGPSSAGSVDINAPVKHNLKMIAKCLDRKVQDLVVSVLDRERHQKLIKEIREAGARIRLISDGDLSAGIAAAIRGTGIHAVMGSGGAPEGVLTAAALRCIGGEIQGKLVLTKPEHRARAEKMGITDPERIYFTEDLAPGKSIIFVATGVTDGALLKGVRFFGGGARTHTVVMSAETKHIRFIDTIHIKTDEKIPIKF